MSTEKDTVENTALTKHLPGEGGEVVQHLVVLLRPGLLPLAGLGEGEDGTSSPVPTSGQQDQPLLQGGLQVLAPRTSEPSGS